MFVTKGPAWVQAVKQKIKTSKLKYFIDVLLNKKNRLVRATGSTSLFTK